MHPRSTSLQHVDRPVPAVRRFQHHLGVGSGLLELQFQGDRIVDDADRAELLAAVGLPHDHRPLPMQIVPTNCFPSYSHIGASRDSWKVSTPSIRRGRHEERRPRPFIASSRRGMARLKQPGRP